MQGGGMPSGSQGQTGSQPGGASNAQGPSTTGRYERRASAFGKATDYVSSINSTVNVSVVGELVLIGLALTVISSLAAVVVIMRYEPLQILADRS
jgi:putative ABC transport system permease protein